MPGQNTNLHYAEIEAYEWEAADSVYEGDKVLGIENLLLGAPAYMSSVLANIEAHRGTDGNRDGEMGKESVFHTD